MVLHVIYDEYYPLICVVSRIDDRNQLCSEDRAAGELVVVALLRRDGLLIVFHAIWTTWPFFASVAFQTAVFVGPKFRVIEDLIRSESCEGSAAVSTNHLGEGGLQNFVTSQ